MEASSPTEAVEWAGVGIYTGNVINSPHGNAGLCEETALCLLPAFWPLPQRSVEPEP